MSSHVADTMLYEIDIFRLILIFSKTQICFFFSSFDICWCFPYAHADTFAIFTLLFACLFTKWIQLPHETNWTHIQTLDCCIQLRSAVSVLLNVLVIHWIRCFLSTQTLSPPYVNVRSESTRLKQNLFLFTWWELTLCSYNIDPFLYFQFPASETC